jgi:bifunctional DNA-binding transcriptional regulator/antitoxin component of YhaV-PrlF toxin-antitoxin module
VLGVVPPVEVRIALGLHRGADSEEVIREEHRWVLCGQSFGLDVSTRRMRARVLVGT